MSLAAAALAAFFVSAPLPPVGTIIPGVKPVCDTQAQYQKVWEAHKEDGVKGVQRAMNESTEINAAGEPVCGLTRLPMMITRIVDAAWIEWEPGTVMWTIFVEFVAPNGAKAYGVVADPRQEPPKST